MSIPVGKVQAAIWRTEEAIEQQEARIAAAKDPRIAEMELLSLVTMRDVLDIHRKTLEFLLKIPEAPTVRAYPKATSRRLH